MEDSNSVQKSTEPFARRAEQEARRDAIAKARVQAEVDSIEEKRCGCAPSAWHRQASSQIGEAQKPQPLSPRSG